MTGTLQRRLLVLVASAATVIAGWNRIPGTSIDRAAFSAVVRGFTNPPFVITGDGSHASPWTLRTFASHVSADSREAPVIVSLGDDREGFFQSSPPSPIDLAVIFSNMRRLGANNAASAAVLAWDAPDPIGLMALEKTIAHFDSLIVAAPLSRGAVPQAMPPAFRRASIPLDAITGNTASLPAVNRVPLSGIILGGENTLAGFQSLDSEPDTEFIPLIARWDDRAVFAFPLLIALQRLDQPLARMEIRMGEYINPGPGGPIIPIDRYGRLAVTLKPIPASVEIPAETLIDAEDPFPKQTPHPVVLRDDRSASEPATREFSTNLAALSTALSSTTALAPAKVFPRPEANMEVTVLAILALVLVAICGLQTFARNVLFLVLAAVIIAAQTLAAGIAGIWLPGVPALAAVFCALLLSHVRRDSSAPPEPHPVPTPREPTAVPPALVQQQKNQVAPATGSSKSRSRRKKRRR